MNAVQWARYCSMSVDLIFLLHLILVCFPCLRAKHVASRNVARPAKKKAMLYLKERSFDVENEENVVNLSPSHPKPAMQIKTRSVNVT